MLVTSRLASSGLGEHNRWSPLQRAGGLVSGNRGGSLQSGVGGKVGKACPMLCPGRVSYAPFFGKDESCEMIALLHSQLGTCLLAWT